MLDFLRVDRRDRKEFAVRQRGSALFGAYWSPEYAEQPLLFHGRSAPSEEVVIVLVGSRPLSHWSPFHPPQKIRRSDSPHALIAIATTRTMLETPIVRSHLTIGVSS